MREKFSTFAFVLKLSLLMMVLVAGHIAKRKPEMVKEKNNLAGVEEAPAHPPILSFLRNLYN